METPCWSESGSWSWRMLLPWGMSCCMMLPASESKTETENSSQARKQHPYSLHSPENRRCSGMVGRSSCKQGGHINRFLLHRSFGRRTNNNSLIT